MLNQYFAHYLLNRGKLTPSQMFAALEHERSVRVKLGILAINARIMTVAQVEEIHMLQRTHDKQFGALAVDRGYLTVDQLEELLNFQGKENLTFMQAVADKGYLTLMELATTLQEYLQGNDITLEEWASLDNGNEERIIREILDFSAAGQHAEYYYVYVGLLLRNIMRFLNEQPMVIFPSEQCVPEEDWLVTQELSGALNISAGLALKEAVLIKLASRFSGESLTEADELALDSAGEFFNVHNGIFSGTLSQVGLDVELEPQSVQKSKALPSHVYRIPIGTSFGQIDLVLSLR